MSKTNLQDLLNFYEEKLCDRRFCYEISNGEIISVSFYREQFCHLLGLQHIFNYDKRYLGAAGYKKIKSNNVTVKLLKNYNRSQFDTVKERMMRFDEILELMLNGNLISFDMDKAKPKTHIQADFIIFRDDKAYILHLFLRKEREGSNIYAPISFVVKLANDETAKQYLQNQKYQKIVKRDVIKVK